MLLPRTYHAGAYTLEDLEGAELANGVVDDLALVAAGERTPEVDVHPRLLRL